MGAVVALHRDEQQRAQIKNALAFTCRATWSNCNHLGLDAFTELMTIPELRPTWGMEINYAIKKSNGDRLQGKIHNTIHRMGD